MSHGPRPPVALIPGLPVPAAESLLAALNACPRVEEVWLYGSRAMGHQLSHRDRLDLMEAIDALMLPWTVDLSLFAELPADFRAHVSRVGLSLL